MAHTAASYAAALLAAASSPAEAGLFGEALRRYAGALQESRALRCFLLNPALPRAAQKSALTRLAAPGTPEMLLHFLHLLADKGRMALLPAISEEYLRRCAARYNLLLIKVSSAFPLQKGETEKLKDCFTTRCGAAGALLEWELVPGLIGGVRVQVGGVLYDQSLAGRLAGLRRALCAGEL